MIASHGLCISPSLAVKHDNLCFFDLELTLHASKNRSKNYTGLEDPQRPVDRLVKLCFFEDVVMEPELWTRIKPILHAASVLPDGEQADFLSRYCGGDPRVRAEIESLLQADRRPVWQTERLLRDVLQGQRTETARTFGKYRLLHRLGDGGMSSVYLARSDAAPATTVALKILNPELRREPFAGLFLEEASFIKRLDHPGIVRLIEWGMADRTPFLALQPIDGMAIDRYCQRHRLSLRQRLRLLRAVCAVVAFVHARHILHGDLKPGNILIDAIGTPTLIDFGIARRVENSGIASPLPIASPLLTPHYASPEQIAGGPLTLRTDVYALGVLLYRILSGKLPYQFEVYTPAEIRRVLCEVDPNPEPLAGLGDDRSLCPSRCRRLPGLILRTLDKDPQRRPASALELVEELKELTAF